jgi:uncharacterized protein (DUF983 family)
LSETHDRRSRAGVGTIVWRGFRLRCGRCGGRGIFRSYFELRERCPRCGYRLERDEAAFTGVWLLNYTFTILPLLALLGYMVYLLASDRPVSVGWFVVAAAVIVTVLPIVLYPVAKSLWASIDLAMRPLEPVEEAEAAVHESQPDALDPPDAPDAPDADR